MATLKDQYVVLRLIGKGGTSSVVVAQHRFTEMLVAIKMLRNEEKNLRYVYSEVGIMELLKHSNILRIFQIHVTPKNLYIVMEYAAGGDLTEHIRHLGRLQEEEARTLFRQIADAIKYCHERGIVHRDLKSRNILLDSDGNAKVSDFGLATKCDPGNLLQRRCGTYPYSAPELFSPGPYDARKLDVWSLGVLLYEMTTGDYPFKGGSRAEVVNKISRGIYQLPDYIPEQIGDLICKLLTLDPGERPTLDKIMKHPWLSQGEVFHARRPSHIDPNYPDPSLLNVLSLMGYDLNKIRKSLQRREYDEYMGTYLLLQQQGEKGLMLGVHAHPVYSGVTPCLKPVECSSSTIPLKRTVSLPSINPISLSLIPPLANDEIIARKKLHRCASSRDIVLCPPDDNTLRLATQGGAMTAPRERSKKISDEIQLTTGHAPDMTPSGPAIRLPCWRRVGRRIRRCLSRLCCCLTGQQTRPRVSPVTVSANRAHPETKLHRKPGQTEVWEAPHEEQQGGSTEKLEGHVELKEGHQELKEGH